MVNSKPDTGLPHSQRGFTILELLVTVAIIGVLAALILPFLKRGKAEALAAKCAGNLRQISVAMFSYVAENDGFLPGPAYAQVSAQVNLTTNPNTLPALLAPYIEQDRGGKRVVRLFSCPAWEQLSDRSATDTLFLLASGVGGTENKGGPGGVSNVFGVPETAGSPAGTSKAPHRLLEVASVTKLGNTRMMYEIDKASPDVQERNLSASIQANLAAKPFHENFRNSLYFDGSVRRIPTTTSKQSPQ